MSKEAAKVADVAIERSGNKIIIPEDMDYEVAQKSLARRAAAENSEIAVNVVFPFGVAEGAVAFARVLEQRFGFMNAERTPGFFGSTPPEFISVDLSPTEKKLIPWCRLSIPGVVGFLQPHYVLVNGQACFRFVGTVLGKSKRLVDEIAELVKQEYARSSIYRGQAVLVNFPDLENVTSLNDFFPTFLDLPQITPDKAIFTKETDEVIRNALYTPILQTARCRKHKVPLKRGILFEGPFGVGKTLTASVTSKLCKDNGWTFVYVGDVRQLAQALTFAKNYQPCVVFAEDIDQALQAEEDRDEKVNAVLNTVDGIGSKETEIIVVLTTNNVEGITQAMLRPGRLDAVVSVRPPDAGAVERLVRLYAGDMLSPSESLTEVGQILAGKIPAMIREVVERSKLAAMNREQDGDNVMLVAHDLEVTALGMATHMKLLEPKVEDTRAVTIQAADISAKGMMEAAKLIVGAVMQPRSMNGKGDYQQLAPRSSGVGGE